MYIFKFLIITIFLFGCVKCPNSISISPKINSNINITEYNIRQFDIYYFVGGINISAIWHIPLENSELCNKFDFKKLKLQKN